MQHRETIWHLEREPDGTERVVISEREDSKAWVSAVNACDLEAWA